MKLSKHPSALYPGGWVYRAVTGEIRFSLYPPYTGSTYKLTTRHPYKSLQFQTIEAAETYLVLLGHEIER